MDKEFEQVLKQKNELMNIKNVQKQGKEIHENATKSQEYEIPDEEIVPL